MAESHRGMGLTSLLSNTGATLGRQLLSGLLGLVTMAVIARVFGPEANGAYTVALLLPGMMATFLNLGIGSANIYYLGSGQYRPRSVFRTSMILVSWLSVLGTVAGAALILTKGETLFPGMPEIMLWLALLTFPPALIQSVINSIFQGLQQFKVFNLSVLAQPLITFLIIVALSIAGISDFVWLIVANLVGVLITLVITSLLLRDRLRDGHSPQQYKLGKALVYGYKVHIGNILGFLNYKADIFLVNLLIDPAAAGVYVVALTLGERLWLLSAAVSTVALPRLAQLSGDEDTRRRLTPLLTRLVLLVTVAGAGLLGLLASPLIKLIFGPLFTESVTALLILLPGVVFMAAARILAHDIAARGRPEINMYITLLIVAVNILGNVWLIPILGITGAAIATSAAYSLSLVLWTAVYWQLTRVSLRELLIVQRQDLDAMMSFVSAHR